MCAITEIIYDHSSCPRRFETAHTWVAELCANNTANDGDGNQNGKWRRIEWKSYIGIDEAKKWIKNPKLGLAMTGVPRKDGKQHYELGKRTSCDGKIGRAHV